MIHLPGINSYKKGCDVFFNTYEDDAETILWNGYKGDHDEQRVMMSKIANMISNDIFSSTCKFTGSFERESQVKSVPQSIIDGSVLVNILKPIACKAFGDYASKVFVPHIEKELTNVCRLDIVFDQYWDNSP